MKVIIESGSRPLKAWVNEIDVPFDGVQKEDGTQVAFKKLDIEPAALKQAMDIARLPFIHQNGVALMPDVHAGKGSTVGTVIATENVVIPAAVGVDIGCGMVAVRLSLKASQLPDSLADVRHQIERDVPLGAGGAHKDGREPFDNGVVNMLTYEQHAAIVGELFGSDIDKFRKKALPQLGTLGSGNHFIELCIDENDSVWVMLHSGSRGIGNMIGTRYIEKAKRKMEAFFITLPDADLAYIPEGEDDFEAYIEAVHWAQDYAKENRRAILEAVLNALRRTVPVEFTVTEEAINCHHNYVTKENHFGKNLWITRKGAVRAGKGDLGIIPGSMGQQSYIVRGKGNLESYCSCSHGAGRQMSRAEAKRRFSIADLVAQTEGVECRKDIDVLDEIPGAYKRLDVVMENQKDLVEVVHTLKAILCVKGN